MKIIIVGCGKVGYAIAQQLTQEKHDITLVDDEAAHLSRADNTLDAMCIHGNGASISVLMEAGAREADLVIAVTGVDETNLVCSLIAKSVGAQHTIARVRNPEYRRDADMLKREIGLDMVINPDLAAAEEIARILSFPAAISVEPFAGGRIDMIGFQMSPDDTILGRTLSDFHRERVAEVLICAAQRGDEFLIPNGAFVPQADDRLYMVGSKAELHKMLKHMGRSLQRVKDVSILGGSRISMYLSWELARAGTRVHIVEQDHDKCLRLSQELPDAMIIEGDGTDNDMIRSENLFGTDGFVALTGRDEENLLMALARRGEKGAGQDDPPQLHGSGAGDGAGQHHQPQGHHRQPDHPLRPGAGQLAGHGGGVAVQAAGRQGGGAGVHREKRRLRHPAHAADEAAPAPRRAAGSHRAGGAHHHPRRHDHHRAGGSRAGGDKRHGSDGLEAYSGVSAA